MSGCDQTQSPRVRWIRSPASGRTVAIVGYVHGDEASGEAVLRLPKLIEKLQRGNLVLVEGNPAAREAGVRYIAQDLNRLFDPDLGGTPNSIEGQIALKMQAELGSVDTIIDLHATSTPTSPFCAAFVDDEVTEHLTSALGIPLVTGFQDHLKGTLIEWASKRGIYAIAMECGLRNDPATADSATWLALSALAALGMIDLPISPRPWKERPAHRHYHIVGSMGVRDAESFSYRVEPSSFMALPPRTLIGDDKLGKYYSPERECVMVMPASTQEVRSSGGPAFFFAAGSNPL